MRRWSTSAKGKKRYERREKGRERERERTQVGVELDGEGQGESESEGESEDEDRTSAVACAACLTRRQHGNGGECTVQTSMRAQVGGPRVHVSLPCGRRGRTMHERGEWFIRVVGRCHLRPSGARAR